MNKLILFTIALALTPTAYAQEEDRDKYYYFCSGSQIHNLECPYLKKGDTILQARAAVALTYCDRDYPILRDGDVEEFDEPTPLYTCVYNGKPAKSFTLSSQITKPWINQFD